MSFTRKLLVAGALALGMTLPAPVSADAATTLGDGWTLLATPSATAAAWSSCPSGMFCAYSKPGGKGNVWGTSKNWSTFPAAWDKKIRSAWDHTSKARCLYNGKKYTGYATIYYPGNRHDLDPGTSKPRSMRTAKSGTYCYF